jgi:hypothetical protein
MPSEARFRLFFYVAVSFMVIATIVLSITAFMSIRSDQEIAANAQLVAERSAGSRLLLCQMIDKLKIEDKHDLCSPIVLQELKSKLKR